MDHYMPEIFYHDRKALLSVDIHPSCSNGKYKFVTSSVQNEVRIWEFEFEKVNLEVAPLAVHFVASLSAHNAAVNQVKFCQNPEFNLLASGDCHGRIAVWQLSDQPACQLPSEDLPPNKENWVRIKVLNHESDVTALCWSPCGKYLASVSNDDSVLVHEALTGKRMVCVGHLRHFPNGISWDPLGKYLVTMSTDRKMDLLDASKGTKLRCFGVTELPATNICSTTLEEKTYKLFHDDQLMFFQRGVSFSPCGQLIIAPCGRLEVGADDVHGTLVFKRWELDRDRPAIVLPSDKPTFVVRFNPIIFKLREESDINFIGLPYRLVWLVLTKDSVIFYDSQHSYPIGLVENIHYNNITEAAWTSDGKNVIISSMEGYCSFLKLNIKEWGTPLDVAPSTFQCPSSPQLIKSRAKKERKEKNVEAKNVTPSKMTSLRGSPAPITPKPAPITPKSGGLLRFLKKETSVPSSPVETESSQRVNSNTEPIKKKRVNLVTVDE